MKRLIESDKFQYLKLVYKIKKCYLLYRFFNKLVAYFKMCGLLKKKARSTIKHDLTQVKLLKSWLCCVILISEVKL